MSKEPQAIRGDYQFWVMQHGPRVQRFWHRNKIQVMERALPVSAAEVLVDIGCGSGNLIFRGGAGARLALGLDVSEAALRFCNSRKDGTPCVFVCARGDAFPLPEACADAALLVEVIEHLSSPREVLGEIWRILRDGGRLFITTPNYAFPSLWPAWEWLADRSGLVPRMAGEQHVQKFGPDSLQALVRQTGFAADRLGTFYHWSPFASLISESWADGLVAREVEGGARSGALVYCVARKVRGRPAAVA